MKSDMMTLILDYIESNDQVIEHLRKEASDKDALIRKLQSELKDRSLEKKADEVKTEPADNKEACQEQASNPAEIVSDDKTNKDASENSKTDADSWSLGSGVDNRISAPGDRSKLGEADRVLFSHLGLI